MNGAAVFGKIGSGYRVAAGIRFPDLHDGEQVILTHFSTTGAIRGMQPNSPHFKAIFLTTIDARDELAHLLAFLAETLDRPSIPRNSKMRLDHNQDAEPGYWGKKA